MPVINMRTGVSILSQLSTFQSKISVEKVSYSDISGLSFSHHNVVWSVKKESSQKLFSRASSDPAVIVILETEKGI